MRCSCSGRESHRSFATKPWRNSFYCIGRTDSSSVSRANSSSRWEFGRLRRLSKAVNSHKRSEQWCLTMRLGGSMYSSISLQAGC